MLYYFPWSFSLLLLQADYTSLEFSFFCRRKISYRLDISFRCEVTFMSQVRESSSLSSFLSPAYAVTVQHIKYTLLGELLTKVEKASRRHLCFEFSYFNLALLSDFSLARDARVTCSRREKTSSSHLYSSLLVWLMLSLFANLSSLPCCLLLIAVGHGLTNKSVLCNCVVGTIGELEAQLFFLSWMIVVILCHFFRYYRDEEDVVRDEELQAYVNEVSAEGTGPNGGIGRVNTIIKN